MKPMPDQVQAPPRLYTAIQHPTPEAIVVHCSDPRFQVAFEQFITNELGLRKGSYIPLVISGGAGVLGHPEHLPKEFKFLKERFEHYRSVFPSIRRIVLVHHEDCKYYDFLKGKVLHFLGARPQGAPEQMREDLGLLGKVFYRLLSHLGVPVELYYGKFADVEHSKIVFAKLDA